YVVLPGGPRGIHVKVGSLDGGQGRDLLDADSGPIYADPGYLVYQRNRNLVAQRFDAGSLRLEGDPSALPDMPAQSQFTGSHAATVSAGGALAYMNGTVTNNRLVWFDRSGHVVGTVPVPPAQYQFVSLSPDERTLAVDRFVSPNESDLWLVDL